jgi:hypothetical protein
MTKLLLTGIAALFLATGTARAGTLLAKQWVNFCTSKNEKELSMCAFYALGLFDGLVIWKVNSSDPINLCVPEEPERRVSAKQIMDVGLAYIQKNSENNDRPIAVVLREAFEEKWPCVEM